MSRVEITEANLDACLADLVAPPDRLLALDAPVVPGSSLTAGLARDLFRWMVTSRALDVAARHMKGAGTGYYTISSAGHEDNVLLGALLRPTDPCFLHYRSGALMAARQRHDRERDFVRDTIHSFAAAVADPVSAGRHKVWGSRATWVPPQTSTIASHLPKAVGTAIAIGRAERGDLVRPAPGAELPRDAIVLCSFGDASLNHATAAAGITLARYARRQGGAVPVLFVCEDNGIGISVPTPRRWVAASMSGLPNLTYVLADGDLDARYATVEDAIARCRDARAPVFLHLRTVRLWGHAGSDVEQAYRTREEIEASEAADPIVRTARWLVDRGAATPEEVRDIVASVRAEVAAAEAAVDVTTLDSRDAVIRSLVPRPDAPLTDPGAAEPADARREALGGALPEDARAPLHRTLGAHLTATLHDALRHRPEIVVFGEDVGRKGGVYGITAGLQARFGRTRVFDTLLDETSILGAAQGFGLLGYLPVPEIQYLAYVHNALDQIRGEAASTAFFSDAQFATPMVVRIAGLAYQKGFGGHFHNDNAFGALRDIPGLVLVTPSRGDDGVRLLRGALALAGDQGRVVVFLEPIALYHRRDLHGDGDGGWLTTHPSPGELLRPGQAGVYPAGGHEPTQITVGGETLPHAPAVLDASTDLDDGADVLVITYANGLPMTLRVARRLAPQGARVRVLDLRWLNPLPVDAIRRHAAAVGRVVVADEARATGGGVADAVIAAIAEADLPVRVRSARSADSYVPLGPAADHVLLTEEQIAAAIVDVRSTG
jgi:2-oxoisovalerate dehydrogenase E1 component